MYFLKLVFGNLFLENRIMMNNFKYNPFQNPKRFYFFILILLGIFCMVDVSFAHKVMIFAWVEGDMIHTQSKFSGGKRVKDSQVIVQDLSGKKLLEGKTDENGEFSFKKPETLGLKVVLNSSMGHMAEWIIPAEEMGAQSKITERLEPDAGNQTNATADVYSPNPSEVPPLPPANPADITRGCNDRDLQDMIDRSLDKKLSPIMDMLIESLDRKPKMSDIIGGIGYIIGLVGLALYFMSRKKGE